MTEKEHPYRPMPARMHLQPRAATVVAAGQSANGREHLHRVVEALAVGEGNLVTVTDLRWTTTAELQGPGLGVFHLASIPVVPELRRECTTFHTTMTREQVRSAFFDNADLVSSVPALPSAGEERVRLESAITLLLQLHRLAADVWDGGLEDDAGAWPLLREQIGTWLRSETERRQTVLAEVRSIPPTVKDG